MDCFKDQIQLESLLLLLFILLQASHRLHPSHDPSLNLMVPPTFVKLPFFRLHLSPDPSLNLMAPPIFVKLPLCRLYPTPDYESNDPEHFEGCLRPTLLLSLVVDDHSY